MAAIAATIRKFQSLRIRPQSSNSSSLQCFSATSSVATSLLSQCEPQLSCKTLMIRNFSSRPPPPPPRSLSYPPSSRTEPPSQQGRLQRPPSISLNRIPPKLRNHAVSLFHGDYQDYEEKPKEWKMGPFEYEGDRHSRDDDEDYGINSETADDFDEDEDGDNADWSNDDDEISFRDRWIIRKAQLDEKAEKAQKEKWIKNAQPKVFVAKIDSRGRSYGRGGRKTAHARVWIQPGFGNIVINRKDFVEYFTRDSDREMIVMPMVVTGTAGQFDVQAYVFGSGLTGQAGAVRHGVARALQNYNPALYRSVLKRFGYLTRDPRQVERKKIAHKKARKKEQWNRR